MGVTTMNMEGIPKDRLYYILRPDGATEGTIFTPVDNDKMVMRKLLTREEAEELIDEIPEIEILGIENVRNFGKKRTKNASAAASAGSCCV